MSATSAFISSDERHFMATISKIVYCNPFLPERLAYEREVLENDFVDAGNVWNLTPDVRGNRTNIEILRRRVEALADVLRQRLTEGASAGAGDLALYQDLVLYLLYYRVQGPFLSAVANPAGGADLGPAWESFERDVRRFMRIDGVHFPIEYDPAHLFACFFQIRRAFHHIFEQIVGRSLPIARLRAAIWQSIFTHDMRRYQRVLYDKLADFATLIVGPSGTGKELVASAIALAGHLPFDPRKKAFAEDFTTLFHPLNLSALSPTLIESELFGHRRGAFTGALQDRIGWLESCQPLGTVFLDEIGELDPLLQVKLLRVLQTRTFQRLGDTTTRRFAGKILAATNRDLAAGMAAGRFRADFYYRLCSDIIHTPSLREVLAESPGELHGLVLHLTRRFVPDDAAPLADEIAGWIERSLGRDYAWPGNFRELEQCVRNVLIRREYRPIGPTRADANSTLTAALAGSSLTAEQLLNVYCALIYRATGSYEETARRLHLDRRTVKAKVDAAGRGD